MRQHKNLMRIQTRYFRIERQVWSDSPLDRSCPIVLTGDKDTRQTSKMFLQKAMCDASTRFLFYREGENQAGEIAIDQRKDNYALAWRTWSYVKELDLKPYETEDEGNTTVFLLGKRKSENMQDTFFTKDPVLNMDGWRFAIDVSHISRENVCKIIQTNSEDDLQVNTMFKSARSLLIKYILDRCAIAVVGQAISRLNWHRQVNFCRSTGNKTMPGSAGHKRIDPLQKGHHAITYPRTNPVSIMLIQSPDGKECLLGRTLRRHNSNIYSCLAGFVDQCESVEDAVRRETFEESGIHIGDDIQIIGTQPWPIGAGGNNELMIGCIARATSKKIKIEESEMSDVRWFSRTEALKMLKLSENKNADGKGKPLAVPGSFAIAHHLIKSWAEQDIWKSPSNSIMLPILASTTIGIFLGYILSKL